MDRKRLEKRARAERGMVLRGDLPEARRLARRLLREQPVPREHLRTYAMFVGYPRSGHSLLGSWLDAHPDMVFAHELHALMLLEEGFSRDEIYQLLVENARLFATIGRLWGDYSYGVDGQWQGRHRRLQVIGDKKGTGSVRYLTRSPELLDQVLAFEKDCRFIHVIRNPYDNIATGWRKGNYGKHGESLEQAVDAHFALCERVVWLRDRVGREAMIDVRHEELIEKPRRSLRRVCEFLGVEADRDYLDACASITFESSRKSRHGVKWEPGTIARVKQRMSEFDFLAGYSFEG